MAYKIDYTTGNAKKQASSQSENGLRVLAIVLALLCGMGTYCLRRPLAKLLLPQNVRAAAMAAEQMASELRDGKSFREAISVFYQEIAEGDYE